MLPTLHVIGCGKLGRTLARLWQQQRIFTIGYVVTRSQVSASIAQQFIGGGIATDNIETIKRTRLPTVWLLSTNDAQLPDLVTQLLSQRQCLAGDIVFHCSGATSSAILQPLQAIGVYTASVHPIHTFANPTHSLTTFSGSYCAYEGDEEALTLLRSAFAQIGGTLIAIDAEHKSLYHAGSVIACNYLVALLESSLQSFAAAGIKREQACQLLLPIVHQTVDNVLHGSPTSALTGPISRGDFSTVDGQLQALTQLNSNVADIYRSLGRETLAIATDQGFASSDDLQKIRQLLK